MKPQTRTNLVIHELQDLGLHVLLLRLDLLHPLGSVLEQQLLLQLVPIRDVQPIHKVEDGGELHLYVVGNVVLLQDGLLRVTPNKHTNIGLTDLLHHRRKHLDHSECVISSHTVVDAIQSLLLLLCHHVALNLLQLLVHARLQPVGVLAGEKPKPKTHFSQIVRNRLEARLALLLVETRGLQLEKSRNGDLLNASRLRNYEDNTASLQRTNSRHGDYNTIRVNLCVQ